MVFTVDERDVLVEACEEYLSGLGASLWGRAFDAHSDAGREVAARWLATQIEGVIQCLESDDDSPALQVVP